MAIQHTSPRQAIERWLMIDPPRLAETAGNWLTGAACALPQPEGDLGARMRRGFEQAERAGASAIVAVGAVAPAVKAVRDLDRLDDLQALRREGWPLDAE